MSYVPEDVKKMLKSRTLSWIWIWLKKEKKIQLDSLGFVTIRKIDFNTMIL